MKHKPKLVIFVDLDETILINAFESAIFPAVAKMIAEKTDKSISAIISKFYEEYNERKKKKMDPLLAVDWDNIVYSVAKEYDVDLKVDIEKLVHKYATPSHIYILDNADVVLSGLHMPNRTIVANTNGLSKYQKPVMKALMLDICFNGFLAPDSNNALKGEKKFYGDYLLNADILVSVGNSYELDIVKPNLLGMKTVWLNKNIEADISRLSPFIRPEKTGLLKHERIKPDAIINNLAELPQVIEQIESQTMI